MAQTPTPTAGTPTPVRAEIQALRAIAVFAVVLYHLWPGRLPGGYVGVDIFFAISGFLIIGHLLREVDAYGKISLLGFWAKRARRLLPASLVVIVATAVATVVFVPDVVWRQWFQEMGASAIYVQNWLLAANAVDYLGADNAASPTQHFWSLSVEEQFYIFWPILIVIVLAVCRLVGSRHRRRAIGALLLVLTAASLAFSIYAVAAQPAAAYFVTHSRAWEFGLGGLLAYVATVPLANRDRLRAAVSWLGLAGIAVSVLVFTAETPFPGIAAALPVVATLAVIWAATPSVRWAPTALFRLRPVQWFGDISYSFYLWHWAPIVIAPFILGHELGIYSRTAILAGAIVVAWLSKRFIEDPVRLAPVLVRRGPWLSVTGALAATAVVLAGCVLVDSQTEQRFEADAAMAASAQVMCLGAHAMAPGARCKEPFAVTAATSPGQAKADIGKGVREVDDCKQFIDQAAVIACDIGDVDDPRQTIALVGDSHAGVYLEPLDAYGKSHRVKFVTFLKTWCAGTGAPEVFVLTGTPEITASCSTWGADVLHTIASSSDFDGVVFANYTQAYQNPLPGSYGRPIAAADYTTAWDEILDSGTPVAVLRDIPNAGGVVIPDCVAANSTVYDPCTTDIAIAEVPESVDVQMIAATKRSEVNVVDLTDVFCDEARCHSVIGGLIVYFDNHHLTSAFARSMSDVLGSRVVDALSPTR